MPGRRKNHKKNNFFFKKDLVEGNGDGMARAGSSQLDCLWPGIMWLFSSMQNYFLSTRASGEVKMVTF